MVRSRMSSSSRTVTRRSCLARSWCTPGPSVALSFKRSDPGAGPYWIVDLTRPRPSGRYQIGDDHDRSWIVLGMLESQQSANADGTDAGSLQSIPFSLQTYVLQRQVGFSRTRA